MKGVYVLVIEIPIDINISIGSLGDIYLKKGIWLYVGSAMGRGSTSLENRIRRHFRHDKKIYWHIDYLLSGKARVLAAVMAKSSHSMECQVARNIELFHKCERGPKGFGASDCRKNCFTHLFYCQSNKNPQEVIREIFDNLGLKSEIATEAFLIEYPSSKY